MNSNSALNIESCNNVYIASVVVNNVYCETTVPVNVYES